MQAGRKGKGTKKKPTKAAAAAFDDLAWLLLDEARILDGLAPADPALFSERVNRLVLAGLA